MEEALRRAKYVVVFRANLCNMCTNPAPFVEIALWVVNCLWQLVQIFDLVAPLVVMPGSREHLCKPASSSCGQGRSPSGP